MLKAAPDRNSALGFFRLVLRSVESNSTSQLSDALKGHVVDVLREASRVAANAQVISPNTPAEVIQLALLLRKHAGLTDRIGHIVDFENINEDLAKDLLKSLQAVAA